MTASTSPRARIEGACQRLGRQVVIERCYAVLGGTFEDAGFILILGGVPARRLLHETPAGQEYWLRVWALRGLLWAGVGEHPERLAERARDEAWRVREMVCKVTARHRVHELLDSAVTLESDPVSRVRAAATRAVRRILAGR